MFEYQIEKQMSGRVLMAKDMIFGSIGFVWFLWCIGVIMASQEGKKKQKTGRHLTLIRRIMKFSFFLKYAAISNQKVIMKEWTGNQKAQSMNW